MQDTGGWCFGSRHQREAVKEHGGRRWPYPARSRVPGWGLCSLWVRAVGELSSLLSSYFSWHVTSLEKQFMCCVHTASCIAWWNFIHGTFLCKQHPDEEAEHDQPPTPRWGSRSPRYLLSWCLMVKTSFIHFCIFLAMGFCGISFFFFSFTTGLFFSTEWFRLP